MDGRSGGSTRLGGFESTCCTFDSTFPHTSVYIELISALLLHPKLDSSLPLNINRILNQVSKSYPIILGTLFIAQTSDKSTGEHKNSYLIYIIPIPILIIFR